MALMQAIELVWHNLPSVASLREASLEEISQQYDKPFRVLAYSPIYSSQDPMKYRVMDFQFLKIATEVTGIAVLPEEIVAVEPIEFDQTELP